MIGCFLTKHRNEEKHNIELQMDCRLLKLNSFTKRNIEMLKMFTYVMSE